MANFQIKNGVAIIPEGTTEIPNRAFRDCKELTTVVIPEGVTSIGESAFYQCSALTSITIPESVTSIEESTFEDCSALKTIYVPAGKVGYFKGRLPKELRDKIVEME